MKYIESLERVMGIVLYNRNLWEFEKDIAGKIEKYEDLQTMRKICQMTNEDTIQCNVELKMLEHPDAPADIRQTLAEEGADFTKVHLARQLPIDDPLVEKMLLNYGKKDFSSFQMELAKKTNRPVAITARLVDSQYSNVLMSLLKHPEELTEEQLLRMAGRSRDVDLKILDSKRANEQILKKIADANGHEEEIQKKIAEDKNLTLEVIKILLSKNPKKRMETMLSKKAIAFI